jgi:hypothetical protein
LYSICAFWRGNGKAGDVMAQVMALKSGGKVQGIIPQTVEEVFRLAQAVSISGLAPKSMSTPEQITVAILHGAELGLPPMQAIQRIAVVNGRPTVWGDAIPAMLWGAGFKVEEFMTGAADMSRTAVCRVTRPTGELIERSFTAADAKKAGLWGKTGPWTQYPDRMLQMRARGFAARDGAADVLGGLYLREELDEDEMRDVTPGPALTGPRRTASSVRKSGDYERFEAAVRACKTTDELSTVLNEWKALLQTMPESWEANANAFVVQFRQIMTATPVEADEPMTDEAGFLAKLKEERGYCNSEQDVAELREAFASDLERLSTKGKREASLILEVE